MCGGWGGFYLLNPSALPPPLFLLQAHLHLVPAFRSDLLLYHCRFLFRSIPCHLGLSSPILCFEQSKVQNVDLVGQSHDLHDCKFQVLIRHFVG